MRKLKICPWCGRGRAQLYVRYAAGTDHWFHAKCKREHAAWLKRAIRAARENLRKLEAMQHQEE